MTPPRSHASPLAPPPSIAEGDGGDQPTKKKAKKRHRPLVLEDEDYDLLEENTVSGSSPMP